jgi:multicomponent Na+:H+ antiporter subunit G
VTPTDLAVLSLVAGSVALSVVAVVGFARLPDAFGRAHAASKSETLGALLGLAAAAVALGPGTDALKVGLLAAFLLVTSPTAVHAIVRASVRAGERPRGTDGTTLDREDTRVGQRGGDRR